MTIDYIRSILKKELTEARLVHSLAVEDAVLSLCSHHGADEENCRIAALLHDLAKDRSQGELDAYVEKYDLDRKYLGNCNLAHGPVGAEIARRKMGVVEEDVLNAIRYHTTGRKKMSITEKIVFVGDSIAVGRRYDGVDELRRMAFLDLDITCIKLIEAMIVRLGKKGIDPAEETMEAYEWFREQVRKRS